MDTALANSGVDHDPIFGISDGTSFAGFIVVDKGNYVNQVPCYKHEGDIIDNTLHSRICNHAGTRVNL